MKKTLTTILTTLVLTNATTQQNLIFDSTFDTGNPSVDYGLGNMNSANYGRMKAINDSTFVYIHNRIDGNDVMGSVFGKMVRSNGTINYFGLQDYYTNYSGYNAEDFMITDVVVAPTGELFVVQNEIYDDNGTYRKGINTTKYHAFSIVSNAWPLATSWGTNGTYLVTAAGDLTKAKGVSFSASGNNLLLFSTFEVTQTQRQIATISIDYSGGTTGHTLTLITDNPNNYLSNVADVLYVSPSEIYVADNAFTRVDGGQGFDEYTDYTRVIRLDNTTGSYTPAYGTTGASELINWNSDNNTNFHQDQITKLEYHGGKVMVVGYTRPFNGSVGNFPPQGRITRLNMDGTNDHSFTMPGGIIFPNFTTNYSSYEFYDIDLTPDGNFLVSSGGYSTVDNTSKCFILVLNATNGDLQTNIGNNGYLFESTNYLHIQQAHYITNGSSDINQHRIVFNGLTNNFTFGASESVLGRLRWSSAPVGIEEVEQTSLRIYPNPASTILNIELNEATQIRIINLLGETVATQKLNTGNNSIDVSNLVSGVYFLQAENGLATKFVKQ